MFWYLYQVMNLQLSLSAKWNILYNLYLFRHLSLASYQLKLSFLLCAVYEINLKAYEIDKRTLGIMLGDRKDCILMRDELVRKCANMVENLHFFLVAYRCNKWKSHLFPNRILFRMYLQPPKNMLVVFFGRRRSLEQLYVVLMQRYKYIFISLKYYKKCDGECIILCLYVDDIYVVKQIWKLLIFLIVR